ncbi:MAG: hypothetical protein JEZ06_24135 [Anaerolineaceae bacterium]|nr:hypothetical protein [Anaerolineaceae bacterium]
MRVKIIPILISTMIILIACALPIPEFSPTPEPPQIQNTATITIQSPIASETATETSVAAPIDPSLTSEPTLTATLSPTQTLPIPQSGTVFGVFVKENINMLHLYDINGNVITAFQTPGLEIYPNSILHIAGPIPQGPITVPIAYFTIENGGEIRVNINDQISTLTNSPYLHTLIGVPGQPIFAYTLVEPSGYDLITKLYFGTLNNIAGTAPIYTHTDVEGYALHPMAIKMVNGQPEGIWFTRQAWGIGGDVVYAPQKSLQYLNLNTLQITQQYTNDRNPSNISVDQILAASVLNGNDLSMTANVLMTASVSFNFPLAVDSDRGAGFAAFSPDNHYIAWMEAGGYRMALVPDFRTRLRVAEVENALVLDIPGNNFLNLIGGNEMYQVEPVGWMDNQTLLVQLISDSNQYALATVSVPGGNITYFSPGEFAAFAYR